MKKVYDLGLRGDAKTFTLLKMTTAQKLSFQMTDAELYTERARMEAIDIFAEIAEQHERWAHNERLRAIQVEIERRGGQ